MPPDIDALLRRAGPRGLAMVALGRSEPTLGRLGHAVLGCETRVMAGRIARIAGGLVEARVDGVRIGELCRLCDPSGLVVEAEVVGVTDGSAFLTPIGDVAGLSARAEVWPSRRQLTVGVGPALLGRVLDGLGRPLDRPDDPPAVEAWLPMTAGVPSALGRKPLSRPLPVGTRVIDGLLTCAEGQRVGIFGPAGAGKSSLVSRIVRGAAADVFVVALVGERGREVSDFLERTLTLAARQRTVVVAATSDRPALERVKAAQVATTIAEWFRDQGKRVVLLVDSLTRLARALREIGLAAGEPPTRRGFPPSVFAALPRLLERAASSDAGTITAFYTVLVEGEATSDPIAEEVKSILDGHLVLCPKLAETDHFPAIDVLRSRSRLMGQVAHPIHRDAAAHLRRLLARHDDIELLVRVGEYQPGSDPLADEAILKKEAIQAFLREPDDEFTAYKQTVRDLYAIATYVAPKPVEPEPVDPASEEPEPASAGMTARSSRHG